MYKICLVEDEVNLNNIVKTYLENAGYEVISFYDGKSALAYIGNEVNLWILDIMLGDDVSGYDIIKKMRENNDQTPVIFTSARDQELDKIIGLELGSDDYVTKPYSPKELVLRVNNIIKRVYTKVTTKTYYETYEIDTERRIILENNQEIPLTTLEYDLVLFFINNKNKSFGREEILKNVWGTDYFGNDRVVDDLIRRVRKKLPKLNINTLYGFGYRLS
ncbi:MAG: response regulator transcription factor [Erysipelotrichaceae bacterium]|nr:response regulator transcription factor [Erysipelotrichaceae bacterium]